MHSQALTVQETAGGEKGIGPFFVLSRQKDFEGVAAEQRLSPEQRKQIQIILYGMLLIILRKSAVDEQSIQGSKPFIRVTDASMSSDQPRRRSIMDSALRMCIDGDVVALFLQQAEKS